MAMLNNQRVTVVIFPIDSNRKQVISQLRYLEASPCIPFYIT
jgi:hypothetical protein